MCDLVIMPQCDALAQLITCQQVLCICPKHIHIHKLSPSNRQYHTGQVSRLLQEQYYCVKGTHTHINGTKQGLEHIVY